MDLGIRGRVAIIASAARPIGLATAMELAREGVRIVAVDDDPGRAAEAARAVADAGADVHAFGADITEAAGARRVVEEARRVFGGSDILVIDPPPPRRVAGRLEDFSDDDLRQAHRRWNMGLVHMARELVPLMRSAGWGRFVTYAASNLAEVDPGPPGYGAGLQVGAAGISKTLAHEFATDGIVANVVSLGFFEGGERRPVPGEDPFPPAMRRPGRPEEAAAVGAFLCSARASYLTGEIIRVDGALGEFIF